MKSAQIDNYGDVSAIMLNDVEKPAIAENQVLIETNAASLNPFDLAVLAGHAQSMAPLTFPATLGLDMAGTVVGVGAAVTKFGIGERVYGTANAMFGASGAFAEYVAANADNIAHSPTNVSDVEAASFPTAGISALQAIVDNLDVQSGQKVFINGGSGGVGSIAIQIAKHLGAYVTVTASATNADFVKSLGADEVIDYKTQDYRTLLRDYDAVLTNVRADDTNDVLTVLKRGGRAVSLVGPFDDARATKLGVTAMPQMTKVTTESLDRLRELVDQGAVHAVIDKTFQLDQIREAYITAQNQSVKGKLVISTA